MPQPGQPSPVVESSCRHYQFHTPLLTGNDEPFGALLVGEDNQDKESVRCGVRLERIELLIFPFEVGFLVLDFRCTDPNATFTDQQKALGMLRMLAPMYMNQPLPLLEVGERKFHVPQLLAFLLSEFANVAKPDVPAKPEPKVPLPVHLINDERMIVYAFSCLDRKSGPPDVGDAEGQMRRRALLSFDEESLTSGRNARERSLAAWQHVRWQSFGKDGGSLVAFHCDPFDEKFLGHYHRTYYFDVFLLALLHRVALLRLYERLADIPSLTTGTAKSHRVLARLRHDLLLFKNQCCFSQITLRERGLQLWRRWQNVFENEQLLKEVNEQSSELEQYLRTQSQERMEWLLRLGGFVATVFPAVLSLNVLLGESEWVSQLKWILLVLLIVTTGIAGIWILFRRPKFD